MKNREYKMPNGMTLKVSNARQKWYPQSVSHYWEILFCTRRGQYWIEKGEEKEDGSITFHAEYLDARAAKRWLEENNRELTEDLKGL